jgi:hypothetical protein
MNAQPSTADRDAIRAAIDACQGRLKHRAQRMKRTSGKAGLGPSSSRLGRRRR